MPGRDRTVTGCASLKRDARRPNVKAAWVDSKVQEL